MSDAIPTAIDIAVPRQSWTPLTRAQVVWHQFDRGTFEVGRIQLEIAPGLAIGLYSPERSIVDAYRLAHLEGPDVAHQALRRWLRRGGQPAALLQVAGSFPRALPVLRRALEVLL